MVAATGAGATTAAAAGRILNHDAAIPKLLEIVSDLQPELALFIFIERETPAGARRTEQLRLVGQGRPPLLAAVVDRGAREDRIGFAVQPVRPVRIDACIAAFDAGIPAGRDAVAEAGTRLELELLLPLDFCSAGYWIDVLVPFPFPLAGEISRPHQPVIEGRLLK